MEVYIEKKNEHCVACMKPNSSYNVSVKFDNNNGSSIPLCKECMKNLAQTISIKIQEDEDNNRKKVYVTDLPKSCVGCNYCFHECRSTYTCVMQNKNFDLYTNEDYMSRQKDCPLKSLSDYTKQVRKEVCDKVREQLQPYFDDKDEENENMLGYPFERFGYEFFICHGSTLRFSQKPCSIEP